MILNRVYPNYFCWDRSPNIGHSSRTVRTTYCADSCTVSTFQVRAVRIGVYATYVQYSVFSVWCEVRSIVLWPTICMFMWYDELQFTFTREVVHFPQITIIGEILSITIYTVHHNTTDNQMLLFSSKYKSEQLLDVTLGNRQFIVQPSTQFM